LTVLLGKPTPTLDKRCGTIAGYRAHRYRKEGSCDLCREAQNAHHKKWRLENKQRVKSSKARYYEKNKQTVLDRQAKYREENPQKIKDGSVRYYAENLEKIKVEDKKRYIKNSQKIKERVKKWKKLNPEKLRGYSNRRRVGKLNLASEPYTTQDILDLWGTECHICHEPIDLLANRQSGSEGWEFGLHLDHVVPLSHGGSDLKSNVKPSHGVCNLKKSFGFPNKTQQGLG
jgi:5-methylcytosine-specific restriction endonuclease McrA